MEKFVLIFLLILPLPISAAAKVDYKKSVVIVYTVKTDNSANYGSGFFISNRLIVTNAHVIAKRAVTTVQTYDNRDSLPITVIYEDQARDIAILEYPMFHEEFLPLSKEVDITEEVEVFGHPVSRGFWKRSTGKVLNDSLYPSDRMYLKDSGEKYLRLSAEIVKGNSGGPVINKKGQVVGISSAHQVFGKEHFYFCISVPSVFQIFEHYLEVD